MSNNVSSIDILNSLVELNNTKLSDTNCLTNRDNISNRLLSRKDINKNMINTSFYIDNDFSRKSYQTQKLEKPSVNNYFNNPNTSQYPIKKTPNNIQDIKQSNIRNKYGSDELNKRIQNYEPLSSRKSLPLTKKRVIMNNKPIDTRQISYN